MPVALKLELGGLFEPSKFSTWQRSMGKDIRAAVGAGMKTGGRDVVEKVRQVYARSVKISKKSAPKTLSMKLFDKKTSELPALLIGSRAPFIAAHAFGAKIPGPVLIPLLEEGKRMGRKKFALIVRELIQHGNAGFRTVNGKTLLFAENIAANSKGLSPFRRAERARTGVKRFARSYEFPIAILVRNVEVKKVFPFEATVRAGLPDITRAIQRELNKG